MTRPNKETEVTLREMGCPYPALDPRTIPWIEGYRAGCAYGFNESRKIAFDCFLNEEAPR